VNGPRSIELWPDGAPGALGTSNDDRPTLDVYPADPSAAVPTAVVVCPGGGYSTLALDHEGAEVARWFNGFGVTAVVLHYRRSPYRHPVPKHDVDRALRWTRHHADRLGVSDRRIGVLGFSAGGHLAATAATLWDEGDASAPDPIDRVSSRPDFALLCYPVITFGPHAHGGSRSNLLGPEPDAALVEALSLETRVNERTPPVFLFHTANDGAVPAENSVLFFAACRRAGVSAELHVYRDGPHGMGLNRHPPASSWPDLAREWLRNLGLLA
jgi:acetyl esterase/lipase